MAVATISPAELAQRQVRGESVQLVDVRTPVEFREVHVQFAQNVPLDQLEPESFRQKSPDSAGGTLYFICQSGGRSQKACEKLQQAGIDYVASVEGGTKACVEAGLPLVRGKKAISLERQVRIAAGSLVVIGVALGYLAHPGFLGIAAFVGSGLVFAGITDTCGMGMLLSRMPWNRCSTGC